MKRLLSVLICALLLVSAFCVSASADNTLTKSYDEAKDGELLYDVVFNAQDGVYVPGVISSVAESEASTVDISADGKTVKLTHAEAQKGRFWWGGAIEGLTLGEGKSYTLTGKVRISGVNAGVYFNNAGTVIDNLYGFYGGRESGDMTLAKGGKKTTGTVMVDGKLLCNGSAYASLDFQGMQAASADGYVDLMIVVEGYNFSVYFNGELFDMHAGTADEFAASGDVGIVFYIYNKDSGIEASNFKLYKGNILNAPVDTDPVVTDAPGVTDAPVVTEAPVDTQPDSPVTGDNGMIWLAIVALVALLGTAVAVKAVRVK